MLELKIDHAGKNISATVLLKGDETPVRLHITDYTLSKGEKGDQLIIQQASCDRAWMDAALQHFLIGRPLTLPAGVSDKLDMFLG